MFWCMFCTLRFCVHNIFPLAVQMVSRRGRKVTVNRKSHQKEAWMHTTWERDWEMRASLCCSPHLLSFYSPRLRPAMCIKIWPAYFGPIPPRGSSNCPSVFGQAWKQADSIQSTMTREWRTQPLNFYLHIGSWECGFNACPVSHVSAAAAVPDAERAMKGAS